MPALTRTAQATLIEPDAFGGYKRHVRQTEALVLAAQSCFPKLQSLSILGLDPFYSEAFASRSFPLSGPLKRLTLENYSRVTSAGALDKADRLATIVESTRDVDCLTISFDCYKSQDSVCCGASLAACLAKSPDWRQSSFCPRLTDLCLKGVWLGTGELEEFLKSHAATIDSLSLSNIILFGGKHGPEGLDLSKSHQPEESLEVDERSGSWIQLFHFMHEELRLNRFDISGSFDEGFRARWLTYSRDYPDPLHYPGTRLKDSIERFVERTSPDPFREHYDQGVRDGWECDQDESWHMIIDHVPPEPVVDNEISVDEGADEDFQGYEDSDEEEF